MSLIAESFCLQNGNLSATVTAPVPETEQRLTLKLDAIKADKVRAWSRTMRARYDSAQTTSDNRRHWANSDNLSAVAANSPEIRRVLRQRARYEVANNSYAKGMESTLSNHTIGTGPRLQILVAGNDAAARKDALLVQQYFADWSLEVGLADTLRVARKAKFHDGEAFCALARKRRLESPVQLGVVGIEADRCADPMFISSLLDFKNIDGIELDEDGDPLIYRILRSHPGDLKTLANEMPYEIPARSMCHWFTKDRPEQYRGIPEITSALTLFADLRRFTLAVIAAAETAADAAGVLYSDAPAGDEAADVEPMDTIELEKRMLLTLPQGWKMGQIKAEQPVTTYAEFKREILKEIARCLNMPYNIAAGDSSDYNFASGRLDHQIYGTSIGIEQSECERVILRKVFNAWMREARLIDGFLPDRFRVAMPRYQWFWDELDLGNPVQMATAQETKLRNHTSTLQREYAAKGLDWQEELEQRALEIKFMDERGIPLERPEIVEVGTVDDSEDATLPPQNETKTKKGSK